MGVHPPLTACAPGAPAAGHQEWRAALLRVVHQALECRDTHMAALCCLALHDPGQAVQVYRCAHQRCCTPLHPHSNPHSVPTCTPATVAARSLDSYMRPRPWPGPRLQGAARLATPSGPTPQSSGAGAHNPPPPRWRRPSTPSQGGGLAGRCCGRGLRPLPARGPHRHRRTHGVRAAAARQRRLRGSGRQPAAGGAGAARGARAGGARLLRGSAGGGGGGLGLCHVSGGGGAG